MLVDVALPLPIPRRFTYRLSRDAVSPGTRVAVPFGRRRLIGWVVGPAEPTVEASRIKAVREVLDSTPSVPPELFRLCRWLAGYYIAPLGQVLRAALPAALSSPRRPDPSAKTRRVLRIQRELPSLRERDEIFGRARRQRACYELLESVGGTLDVAHLTNQAGFSRSVLNGLVGKGLAAFDDEEVERDPFAEIEPVEPGRFALTDAQRTAVDALVRAGRSGDGSAGAGDPSAAPRPFLLHGVTGSGKTQVYIELLKEVVERQGRGAIVLVPEIALTPQTVARFRAHFGDTVAVLHSALSDGERYDAWRALHGGERRIAIGARSAVFAPVRSLGAIVVDEEHESSYKQSESPRYHARDVAVVRAHLSGAVCVLGSATPSLESWMNAAVDKYERLDLPDRVEGRPLPPVRVIDRRRSPDRGHGPDGSERGRPAGGHRRGSSRRTILSDRLAAAVRERIDRSEQVILLLNRRGYATFVRCRACDDVWQCPQCNVSLTFHRSLGRLVCHYCFHDEPRPSRCPRCASEDLTFRGIGTEQVEREVGERFPTAAIARMDVDTTSGKWAHHRILDRFGSGEVDILLGTQMIAKGLDFPTVTLVGVIDADVALNLPDFRASERTFQLLTQVAGRAGRGARGGEVLIQTALANHYAIRAAVEHDYHAFAERELEERRAPGYPPHQRLANIVVSGLEEDAVQEAAETAARWMWRTLRARGLDHVVLAGPAPCPIDRIRRRWRWHFLLRSARPARLEKACRALFEEHSPKRGKADVRLVIDRDPVALL